MATYSEVKSALDSVAAMISINNNTVENAVQLLQNAKDNLSAIPTTYADEIAEINGYTPTGTAEELAQDELSTLTTEFQALISAINSALTELE